MDPAFVARFWSKVEKGEGYSPAACWEWTGAHTPEGYGTAHLPRRSAEAQEAGHTAVGAHRLAYALTHGAAPAGLELDHLCRNRGCCYPGHLEPVTTRVNLLRADGASGLNARKTHCPEGHPLDGDNLLIEQQSGFPSRRCRTCKNRNQAASRLRRRAARTPEQIAADATRERERWRRRQAGGAA